MSINGGNGVVINGNNSRVQATIEAQPAQGRKPANPDPQADGNSAFQGFRWLAPCAEPKPCERAGRLRARAVALTGG
jgi:hypothetical protein